MNLQNFAGKWKSCTLSIWFVYSIGSVYNKRTSKKIILIKKGKWKKRMVKNKIFFKTKNKIYKEVIRKNQQIKMYPLILKETF